MSVAEDMENIRRMKLVRRLARMYPVDTLNVRLTEITKIAQGHDLAPPVAEPEPVVAQREQTATRDRMERGGRNRSKE
jgi:hypothetical protein